MVAMLGLAACAGPPGAAPGARSAFAPGQLVKNDIDRVCEAHREELQKSLRLIAEKLYRRNPREWKKDNRLGPEEALTRLFDAGASWRFAELDGKAGSEAIQLALREDYRGDRVFALVAGLGGMTDAAFDGKREFYMTDELDPQKLHNAARNIEIAMWKLANDRTADGVPMLLTNEAGPPANLSFEREFGKMIGSLDTLSAIIAGKSQRTVVKVLQTMASAVFLPISALK